MRATLEGNELVVATDSWPGSEFVEICRQIPGRRWDGTVNRFPLSSISAVIGLMERFGGELDESLRRFAERNNVTAQVVEPGTQPGAGRVLMHGGQLSLVCPYSERALRAIRGIPGRKWDRQHRVWRFPISVLPKLADTAARFGWEVQEELRSEVAWRKELRRLITADTSRLDFKVGFGVDLMEFQRLGVESMLHIRRRDRGVLLADEMGLGKTIQAIALAYHEDLWPMVVVCPASMKLKWEEEITRCVETVSVEVLFGKSAGALVAKDAYVLNYDILDDWAPVLVGCKPKLVVFDESHYLKNRRAQRTRAAQRLVSESAPFVLCLSGTPAVNRPDELWPQLKLIGWAREFGSPKRWVGREAELNEALRGACMVRRRKQDVLKDLPPVRWVRVPVDGDAQIIERYQKAEDDFRAYLLDEFGSEEGLRKASAAARAGLLVKLSHLVRLAGLAKVREVLEFVGDFEKVVVFGWHREVLEQIAGSNSGSVLLYGGVPAVQRSEMVHRFQNDPETKVFVGSLSASGVGLTLTAASDVVFVEQGWTPAGLDQALARCHRIGQTDSVTGWVFIARSTIDVTIAELIRKKRERVERSIDGSDPQETLSLAVAAKFLRGET